MKPFEVNKILVPVDFTSTCKLAIDHALKLSEAFNAELLLLNVREPLSIGINLADLKISDIDYSNIDSAISSKMSEWQTELSAKSKAKISVHLVTGKIRKEISKFAEENNVDLVVMGTKGDHGLHEMFIGSNAYAVVSSTDKPVITVQMKPSAQMYKHILVPIDNTLYSREKLRYAVEMAEKFGSKLHLYGLIGNTFSDDEKYRLRLAKKMEQVEEYLKEIKISYGTRIEQSDNIAMSVLNYAKELDADLILIANEHDEAVLGWVVSSLTQQIVNHSPIPVMSITPHKGISFFPTLTGGH